MYIFVMNLGVTPRMLERMEKALGKLFYQNDDTLCDRGTFLAPRWKTENPILATFRCGSVLYDIPAHLQI